MMFVMNSLRPLPLLLVLLASCEGSSRLPVAAPSVPAPSVPAPAQTPQPSSHRIAFIDDDVPAALATARAEGKVLLIDAWAPWCHTCLSMKHFVFTDASLAPLAERVVFAAVDTDREANAPFLEKFPITMWPTILILEPHSERILGYWPGAASAAELRELVEDALALFEATASPGDRRHELALARAALARGEYAAASDQFEKLRAGTAPSWARRSDVLLGLLMAKRGAGDFEGCARVGLQHIDEVQGAARAADFCALLLSCAAASRSSAPSPQAGGPDGARAHDVTIARLRRLIQEPPADATPDDRADALAILADALRSEGKRDEARQLHERRVAMLEAAAKQAPSTEAAATYDYGRAVSYMALGRGDDAVRMLQQREQQIPESYEPAARLADVLLELGRLPEALAASERAIARAYGPRKTRYLKTRAEIFRRMGRHAEHIATLEQEVAEHEGLARGQVNQARLDDARKRLEVARAAASKAP